MSTVTDAHRKYECWQVVPVQSLRVCYAMYASESAQCWSDRKDGRNDGGSDDGPGYCWFLAATEGILN